MKKIILLLLALMLVFGVSGCKEEPAVNVEKDKPIIDAEKGNSGDSDISTKLSALQAEIADDGKLIGVAYLGWLEGDMETACEDLTYLDYTKDFPFIKDIDEFAETEGYRMYLIVPADGDVSVSVCRCEFDDEYMPYDGEELINANEPVLVRGNMSDTIPNIYVIAEKGSEKVEYTPVQSGMDGKLENSEDKVYDFTPYDLLPEFSEFDSVPDAVFCGRWVALADDGNGEERTLGLSLEPDGTARYNYGIGNSEILEIFEGTWSLEDDILIFRLSGGPMDSLENPVVLEPYDCSPSFEWEVTAEGLILKHIGGDEILYGTNGDTFVFEPSDY